MTVVDDLAPELPEDEVPGEAAEAASGAAVPGDAPAEDVDPRGEQLAAHDQTDQGPDYQVVDPEAEELLEADQTGDDTPGRADPEDVVIDDEEQLEQAEAVAVAARSTRPARRRQTVAPVKKGAPTPKQKTGADARKRTGPVTFVRQAIDELRKVVWPSGSQTRNYFVVVVVFVVIIMTIVGLLDLLFGWGTLKLFG